MTKNEYPKAIKLLTENEYSFVHKTKYQPISFKHYPRLQKQNRIAAIEIHKELLKEKFANEFNYNIISKDIQSFNKINVMSYKNQLCLSIIAKQINDDGYHFKNISLRNAYDVFLLSKKTNAKKPFNTYKKYKHP